MLEPCDGSVCGDKSIFSDTMPETGSSSVSTKEKLEKAFSVFNEVECGEPLTEQHLRFDFTPNGDDNEYQQDKCLKFWSFINSLPEIQHIRVTPQKPQNNAKKTKTPTVSSDESDAKPSKTAVTVLDKLQDRDMIKHTLDAKMPRSHCSLTSILQEYEPQRMKKKTSDSYPCKITTSSQKLLKPYKVSSSVTSIIKEMEEWDTTHVKSMEPPGHPPALQHCILQRAVHPNYP